MPPEKATAWSTSALSLSNSSAGNSSARASLHNTRDVPPSCPTRSRSKTSAFSAGSCRRAWSLVCQRLLLSVMPYLNPFKVLLPVQKCMCSGEGSRKALLFLAREFFPQGICGAARHVENDRYKLCTLRANLEAQAVRHPVTISPARHCSFGAGISQHQPIGHCSAHISSDLRQQFHCILPSH